MDEHIDFGPLLAVEQYPAPQSSELYHEPTVPLTATTKRKVAALAIEQSDSSAGNFKSKRGRIELRQRNAIVNQLDLGKSIVGAAKREAARIIQEAKQYAQVELEAARKRGVEEGKKEVLASFHDAVTLRRQCLESSKEELAHIALTIAEEVIGDSLRLNPSSLIKRVERALRFALNSQALRLRVNPTDIAFIREELTNLAATPGLQAPITLIPDGAVSSGDATLETESCSITCRVQSHLESIRSHLLNKETLRHL